MKPTFRHARQVAAAGILLLASACAGILARDHVLFPAVQRAWPAVKEDYMLGARLSQPTQIAAATVAQIDQAVATGDYRLLAGVQWSLLDPICRAGVQARITEGEISAGVAGSYHQRLDQFGQAVETLTKRIR